MNIVLELNIVVDTELEHREREVCPSMGSLMLREPDAIALARTFFRCEQARRCPWVLASTR